MNLRFSFRDVLNASVTDMHCVYAKIFADIPALFITFFVSKISFISANQITLFGFGLMIISALLALGGFYGFAAAFFYFGFVCDFVDGKFARLLGKTSIKGKKLDLFCDRVSLVFLSFSYSISLLKSSSIFEAYLLLLFTMIFLVFDTLELTLNILKSSESNLEVDGRSNHFASTTSSSEYFTSLKSLKTWLPSRVGMFGLLFCLAPLTSFLFVTLVCFFRFLSDCFFLVYRFFSA